MENEPKQPRGIRNNNPGNIESISGLKWFHQVGVDESGYLVFDRPEWGIRAAAVILQNYQYYHAINTVTEMLERWAPSNTNPTSHYISFVCTQLGVRPDQPLDFCTVALPLAKAMILFENGIQPYSDSVINRGIELAHTR